MTMIHRLSSRLPAGLRAALLPAWRSVRRAGAGDEEDVMARLLPARARGVAVDIAACDGMTKSNTLALYRRGWTGCAVEADPARFADLARAYRKFPGVVLVRTWVSPENVCAVLRSAGVPQEFDFLNLDIDSYDRDVLDALLQEFRPQLVCAEINEKIPPPIEFSVRYAPGHRWGGDHFYGQSIATLAKVARDRGYGLVELEYNSAFLVPGAEGLSAKEAYRRGYLGRADRLARFPWNADMEPMLMLAPEQQLAFLREKFRAYDGLYDLGV
jgi:hypothetical protein